MAVKTQLVHVEQVTVDEQLLLNISNMIYVYGHVTFIMT